MGELWGEIYFFSQSWGSRFLPFERSGGYLVDFDELVVFDYGGFDFHEM